MQIPEFTPLLIALLTVSGLKLTADWVINGLVVFSKKEKYNPKKNDQLKLPKVSIIICARNESHNLIEFLPKVLEQDYPDFEVVVVNDRSIDDTQTLLNAFAIKHSNLKVTRVQESELHWAGKKFALTIGLKSASNSLVLLTDADCFPESDQWLKEMSSNFSDTKKIILGYGAYQKGTSLINKLIRSEAFTIALQYLGLAKMGVPYMGVGRNLAYNKDLFFDNRGFASHQFMASGDDDLFINEVATKKNTTISFNEKSYTTSIPEKSLKLWMEQKRRHLTTSNRYNFISKFALLFTSSLRYSFYLLLIICFFTELYLVGLILFLLNSISLIALYYLPAKRTKSVDLLIWLPISEFFLLLFYPFLLIWNTIISGNPWKNY